MPKHNTAVAHRAWAQFRFSVVGPLLASPPPAGQLKAHLQQLAQKQWRHPITGAPVHFAFSTIQRWYYLAKNAGPETLKHLSRKVRADKGRTAAVTSRLKRVLLGQYRSHGNWSYQLHYDNLAAAVRADPSLGPLPSYSSVRRFMHRAGCCPRRSAGNTRGAAALQRVQQREVRSFQIAYVNGLWHSDFHHGSRTVLLPDGTWKTPILFAALDDCSRLACHGQWYLAETAEDFVHGLKQAFQKRGLPRMVMTDNGAAMTAGETTGGLEKLAIIHATTLPYSPYQNGKQERFWSQVEGRLMNMLDGVEDLSLDMLNRATQAWLEREYNRKVHTETGRPPIDAFVAGPDVSRPCPDSETLRLSFCRREQRRQRRSDGTISVAGKRFEIPSPYRTLSPVTIRYASWDLRRVYLVDATTGTVLSRLYPQDTIKNADRRRRRLDQPPAGDQSVPPQTGIGPLLKGMMEEYEATGLPPAYIVKPGKEPS